MGDIAIKLTLSFHHRQMLKLLADRGGRNPYTFGRITIEGDFTDEEKKTYAAAADQSVRDMAEKLHIITMTRLIGPTYRPETYELALTDAGRQVIDQMGITVKPQSFNLDLATGKEVKGT